MVCCILSYTYIHTHSRTMNWFISIIMLSWLDSHWQRVGVDMFVWFDATESSDFIYSLLFIWILFNSHSISLSFILFYSFGAYYSVCSLFIWFRQNPKFSAYLLVQTHFKLMQYTFYYWCWHENTKTMAKIQHSGLLFILHRISTNECIRPLRLYKCKILSFVSLGNCLCICPWTYISSSICVRTYREEGNLSLALLSFAINRRCALNQFWSETMLSAIFSPISCTQPWYRKCNVIDWLNTGEFVSNEIPNELKMYNESMQSFLYTNILSQLTPFLSHWNMHQQMVLLSLDSIVNATMTL